MQEGRGSRHHRGPEVRGQRNVRTPRLPSSSGAGTPFVLRLVDEKPHRSILWQVLFSGTSPQREYHHAVSGASVSWTGRGPHAGGGTLHGGRLHWRQDPDLQAHAWCGTCLRLFSTVTPLAAVLSSVRRRFLYELSLAGGFVCRLGRRVLSRGPTVGAGAEPEGSLARPRWTKFKVAANSTMSARRC